MSALWMDHLNAEGPQAACMLRRLRWLCLFFWRTAQSSHSCECDHLALVTMMTVSNLRGMIPRQSADGIVKPLLRLFKPSSFCVTTMACVRMKSISMAFLLVFAALQLGAGGAAYVPTPDGYWLSPYNGATVGQTNTSAVTYQLVLSRSATNSAVASGTFFAYILPHPKDGQAVVNALAAAVLIRRGPDTFDLILETPWHSATWVVSKDGKTAKQYPLGKTSGPELFGPKSGFVKVDISDQGVLGPIKVTDL